MIRRIKMIYTCEKCKFLFEAEIEVTQCPDCGKFEVRPASQQEINEYARYQAEKDAWDFIED